VHAVDEKSDLVGISSAMDTMTEIEDMT
ncbi:uncharacterized protein METZ01_LOCUS376516, partial [marine metagenome]